MSILPSFRSMAKGCLAIIAVFAFALPTMAQETTPPDQKAEQGETEQQKDRMQKRRDRKQEEKPGDEQSDKPTDKKSGKKGKKKDMPATEGRRPMPPNEGDAAARLQRITQMLTKMDTDGDGTISKSEAPERLLTRFDQIDANGDEKIDKQEITAMVKKMGDRAGAKPGDKPPMTDKAPGKDGEPGKGPNAKGQKKMRDRDQKQEDPSGGSVEPIRPGKDG